MKTAQLAWISYDASTKTASQAADERQAVPSASKQLRSEGTGGAGWHWQAEEAARRSVSESGMDSGASDSGLGSNVSQNSLPTTTPPASPMWALGNNLTVHVTLPPFTFAWIEFNGLD